jgi:hypothetical protein
MNNEYFLENFEKSKYVVEVMDKLNISLSTYKMYIKNNKIKSLHLDEECKDESIKIGKQYCGKLKIDNIYSNQIEFSCIVCAQKYIKNKKNFLNGDIKTSCGCRKVHRNPMISSARRVYKTNYSDGNILFEDFFKISQEKCHYCNAIPSRCKNIFKENKNNTNTNKINIINGDFIYNGLDRVDSKLPHDINNIVACCWCCNNSKNNYSYDFFINKIKQINDFKNKNYENNLLNIKNPIITNMYVDKFNKKHNFSKIFGLENKNNTIDIGSKIGNYTVIDFSKKIVKLLCICGSEVTKYTHNVRLMNGKSLFGCGSTAACKNSYSYEKLAISRTFSNTYSDGDMNIHQFYELSQMNCYYCGEKPSNISRYSFDLNNDFNVVYNGVDRIDSLKPHDVKNVVPCCRQCNFMKNTMTLQEFDNWIDNIVKNLNLY